MIQINLLAKKSILTRYHQLNKRCIYTLLAICIVIMLLMMLAIYILQYKSYAIKQENKILIHKIEHLARNANFTSNTFELYDQLNMIDIAEYAKIMQNKKYLAINFLNMWESILSSINQASTHHNGIHALHGADIEAGYYQELFLNQYMAVVLARTIDARLLYTLNNYLTIFNGKNTRFDAYAPLSNNLFHGIKISFYF